MPSNDATSYRACRFLSREEEAAATFPERLDSIWPLLRRFTARYVARLSPRERAAMAPEDVLQGVVLGLMEQDWRWDQARGRYATFARCVFRTVADRLRENARTVPAPANALAHRARLRAKGCAGGLCGRERLTLRRLEAIYREFKTIDEDLA